MRFAVIAAICVAVGGCGDSTARRASHTVSAPAAPANKIVSIEVHGNPAAITTGFGSVWTVGHRNGFIYRIDPHTAKITRTISLGGTYYHGLVAGDGAIWTYRDDQQRLMKIDPRSGRVLAATATSIGLHDLLIAPGGLWALAGGNSLVRIDPQTARIVKRVRLPIRSSPDGFVMALGRGSIWVGGRGLARVETATGRVVRTYQVPGPINTLAVAQNAAYFTEPNKQDLFRLALPGGRVRSLGRVTGQPGVLRLLDGRAFVTDDGSNALVTLDPSSGRRPAALVLRRGPAPGNNQPDGIGLVGMALADGALWLPDWDANEVYRVPLAKVT